MKLNRDQDQRETPRQGLHAATVVFIVFMLAAAAIATGGYLGQKDHTSANQQLDLQPEAQSATHTFRKTGDEPAEEESWPDAPPVTAQSVFAFDPATGKVLYAKNPDDERDIGSTVKIMTALVVTDHAGLDDEILIETDDLVDNLVYSNMQLVAGDTLTVEQLLHGLLIPSGSDGARALSRYVGGLIDPDSPDPRDVFTEAMNQRAEQMGMTHTHFANADGNDARDAYSSARDIATAATELLKNPTLANIVGQAEYAFTSVGPEARDYAGVTTNHLLLDKVEGVSGVKTGSTESAGGCVVLAQTPPGSDSTIIVAVLGSDLTYENGWIATDARWDDATALLDYVDRV
jgi:D-alanyl-D-alanine carboxypeptidase